MESTDAVGAFSKSVRTNWYAPLSMNFFMKGALETPVREGFVEGPDFALLAVRRNVSEIPPRFSCSIEVIIPRHHHLLIAADVEVRMEPAVMDPRPVGQLWHRRRAGLLISCGWPR